MEAGAATNGASTSAKKEINRRGREEGRWPSLNSLALMRKATTPTDISSVDITDWCEVKFWVHNKLHKNCFLVLPKAFYIEWGEDKRYWRWITVKENCFRSCVDILVPQLLKVSWFLLLGKFKTSALSPQTEYEVAFVVKLVRNDRKWPLPVNLELDVPNRPKQMRTENLERKPKEKWIKIRAGEFEMGPETVGTIVFTLHETCQTFKSGLILKGVLIHPKD
ncbi:hypothetical protein BT93_E2100 [Corymbia citriodora subsp. variegata]|nr:hypothetical protein BT93_E2100 [Corymbia citriodora subsp. variegata]